MTGEPGPPRWTERLLSAALPPGIVREDIRGSLAQEYRDRLRRSGRRQADRWYRRQAWGVLVRAVWARVADLWTRGGGVGMGLAVLAQDMKFAWRAARRSPGPHALAILTVTLGVGVNAAMFSVVKGVVLTPLPYPEPDRMVRIWPEKRWAVPMLTDVREATRSFQPVAMAMGTSLTLIGGGEPEVVGGYGVTAGWFELLGGTPLYGRLIRPEDERGADGPVVVLSHGLWERRFGADPSVVGRSVDLSGNGVERRTVVGVMPADFDYYFDDHDFWEPLYTDPELPGYRGAYGGIALARLAPGVSREQANEEVRRLIPDFRARYATQFRESRYSPLDVVPLQESVVAGVRGRLYVLLAAVGFVLLIACTNVANLLLARATTRRSEMGLRLALGADRSRVIRQMVTESVFLGLVGGVAGLAAAALAMPVLRSELARHLPRTAFVQLDVTVVLYAAGISLLAGLVFGVAPALRAASEDPARALGDQGRGVGPGLRRLRMNDALVVAEVGLGLVLVVCAGLMLESLWRLSLVDPGFREEGVLSLNVVVPSGRYDEAGPRGALFTDMLARVEAVPGVESAALVNGTPLLGSWSGIAYQVEGQELVPGESLVTGYRIVSPGYFETLGIRTIEGRTPDESDVADGEAVVAVNEAFVARHWPGENPVGRMVLTSGGEDLARIVGVVSDVRFANLQDEPIPAVYFAAAQASWNVYDMLVRVSRGDPLELTAPVTAAIRAADPNLPVRRPRRLTDMVADAAGDARFYTRLLGAFAGLALALGIVGVYGVMSYSVSQRIGEIGVRVALGASRSSVLAGILRKGMVPVTGGILLGLAGAWGAARVMESLGFLYHVQPTDPWIYGGVAGLLALAGGAAVVVPAGRAVAVDPCSALRAE